MQDRGATGTTDWKQYVIELPVDASATSVVFGMLMPGDGKAWFDDLAIEIDGQRYADRSALDLEFESSSPRGFHTGGSGYSVELDPAAAHGGKQSLCMTYVAAPAKAPASVDQRAVVPQCKAVLAHLEAGRDAYRAKGANDQDVDWAIQNARVVLQSVQMLTDEVSRDRSMADNVKWILDRNPKAKIVLWAHNSHVSAGGFKFESMGTTLRRMYGQDMVVFGFAFNQGSFRSMSENGGGLKDFTVAPLPPGSLDATLASAGIPLFALDLRQAPRWFRHAHRSREIGAIYPDDSSDESGMKLVAPDAFDAMLFVEKTTAARKNATPR